MYMHVKSIKFRHAHLYIATFLPSVQATGGKRCIYIPVYESFVTYNNKEKFIIILLLFMSSTCILCVVHMYMCVYLYAFLVWSKVTSAKMWLK